MAEDKLLSMSLDDIIKLKKASSKASSSRSSSRTRSQIGTRGKANFSVLRRRGRIGVSSNRNLRRGGVKAGFPFRNNRGTFRKRGYRGGQRNLPLRIEDRILQRQRQRNIDLARNRLQAAKKFLINRQRVGVVSRRNMGGVARYQFRRMLVRGTGRGMKRGRGGFRIPSDFLLNTFRTNQLVRLHAYRNKVNRSQSAAMRNQVPAAPSLIVSIENERAGSAAPSSVRGGRRGMRKRGNLGRLNLPTMQLANDRFRQSSPAPFHTGALNPEIQKMIADIQGKSNPATGRISNRFSQRGATRGLGPRGRGQRGLGRGQLTARQLSNRRIDGLNVGLPMTTTCTLNERFGGIM